MRFGGIPFGMFGGGGGFPFEGMGGMQQREPEGPKTFKCYEILGLDKESADQKSIRKAYLKMSRKGPCAHPDRGGDPKKFAKLQEAYDTLKKKKEDYDKYGDAMLAPDWEAKRGHMSRRSEPERKASTFVMKFPVSLADLYKGEQKNISVARKVFINDVTGKVCEGGQEVSKLCSTCGGRGAVMKRFSPQPGYVVQQQVKCPTCGGKGYQMSPGWHLGKKRETLDVFIEKGSKNGDKIKFREKGNMEPGCTTGDVHVVLQQRPHPIFKRKGADLLMKKSIPLVDALCGFDFEIEHLDGRILIVESKPGEVIEDGSIKKIAHEGFPVKGDAGEFGHLFIEFTVDFPTPGSISSSQQQSLYTVLTGRQPPKRSLTVHDASKKSALRRLGSADRKTEESLRKKLVNFKAKLDVWRNGKLQRYDREPSIRADRNKKYHDRPGYVTFLDTTIADKLDAERAKMQAKLSFTADLSTGPRSSELHVADAHDDEEDDREVFVLEDVTRELFGQKTEEIKRGAADESDSDDEGRGRGGGAQQCHVQ